MGQNFTDFAFTSSVKEAQEHYGSRKNYRRMEDDPDRFVLADKEKEFIPTLDFFFMATLLCMKVRKCWGPLRNVFSFGFGR